MSDVEAQPQYRGSATVVYLGPVEPHWDIRATAGEREAIDEFRQRSLARLMLLPPHDPQFRRNRERVMRDAERDGIVVNWDLGVPDEESSEKQGTV